MEETKAENISLEVAPEAYKMYFEEKRAADQAAFDISSMSPPNSPSPVLSPNTPAQNLTSSFDFRFDVSALEHSVETSALDAFQDTFLTMNARLRSPTHSKLRTEEKVSADKSPFETDGRVGSPSAFNEADADCNVLLEGPQLLSGNSKADSMSELRGEVVERTISAARVESARTQDKPLLAPPSEEGSPNGIEREITVDTHSMNGEGSVADLDIEKLALEIEAHNRAMSNAVMLRFVEAKKKLVQHEQEVLQLAHMQHKKELTEMEKTMARLREEHAAAVKRAHDMVDMANRAAELVAVRSNQSRNIGALCSALWKWKEETNWQRYLKRMERKATQQYEQHSLQRKPLRKWLEVTKTGKLQMLDFKTKMFLQDEKKRLADESAGQIDRLQQEAADLREEVLQEKKARAKLEDDMKRAFMRGVCALNIEALSMMKRGGVKALQEEFDSPNTVVAGPPILKEHLQYFEEEKSIQAEGETAEAFYRSKSPEAVRMASPRAKDTDTDAKSSKSEADKNSQEKVPEESEERHSDAEAPEQRTISEKLKVKLAAVMADAGKRVDVRTAGKPTVVDVRSPGGGVLRRQSASKQTRRVSGGSQLAQSSITGPRWN